MQSCDTVRNLCTATENVSANETKSRELVVLDCETPVSQKSNAAPPPILPFGAHGDAAERKHLCVRIGVYSLAMNLREDID